MGVGAAWGAMVGLNALLQGLLLHACMHDHIKACCSRYLNVLFSWCLYALACLQEAWLDEAWVLLQSP